MSGVLQPDAWVRVDMVTTSGTELWQASTRPLGDAPSYQDGFKEPTIESFGSIERALSDLRGNFEVNTLTFTVNDFDGRWRTIASTPLTKYLTSQDVAMLLVSEAGRASLVEPRLLFRGQLTTPTPLPNRKYQITATSRVGAKFGPVDLDGSCLRRTFRSSQWPLLPREYEGTGVRFLWGEKSDHGVTNAAGASIARGMIIPTYCGYPATVTPPTQLLPPTGLACVVTGTGTTIGATIGVTFTNENGETTVTTLYVANYPDKPTTSFYATWTWTNPNGAGTTWKAHQYFDEGNTTRPMHRLDTNVNPASVAGALINPTTSYVDDGDDDHDKSLYPPPPLVNTADVGAEAEFFCLTGNGGSIIEIFASDLAASPSYVAVTTGEIGTGNYFDLGPSNTGYVINIGGEEFFGFSARGPKAQAHKDGTMPFRVNMCGMAGANGEMIKRAFYIYQDIFTQLSGGTDWEGYLGGARLTIPSYRSSPIIPILNSTQFEACQDKTVEWIGDEGYEACVDIDSLDITWGQIIQEMNSTLFCGLVEDHFGQIVPVLIDADDDPDNGPLFREFMEILRVVKAGGVIDSEVETAMDYQYDPPAPGDNGYRSGIYRIENTTASAGYGGKRKSPTVQLKKHTRHPATAHHAAERELAYRSDKPEIISVEMEFQPGLSIDVGQIYRLQHSDLPTEDIYPMVAIRTHVNWPTRTVTLEGRVRTVAIPSGSETLMGDKITNPQLLPDKEAATHLLGDKNA